MDDNEKLHMHNKFAIIDSKILVTGSFNWTMQAATGNQENAAVLEPSPELIKAYQDEFEKLWIQFAGNKITKERAEEVSKLAKEEAS